MHQDYSNNYISSEKILIEKASSMNCAITGSLELLPLCNMDCKMCFIRLDKKKMFEESAGKGLLSLNEWVRIGNMLQEAGVLFLQLTGGEPLLYPHLKELCLELDRMGMILTINTNGTLVNEEWSDFFHKLHMRRINLTLYGTSEETYRSLCGYPDGFNRAMNALDLLTERGVDVKINASLVKKNVHELEGIYKIGEKYKLPVSVDTNILPGRRERRLPFESQERLLPEEAADSYWYVIQKDLDPQYFPQFVKDTYEKVEHSKPCGKKGLQCLASHCSFAVDWKGNLRPCVTLEDPSVSLLSNSFDAAWETIVQKSMSYKRNAACDSCKYQSICLSCVGNGKLETGSYEGLPEYLCRFTSEYYRLLKSEYKRLFLK